jgi:hypothetical protein
MSSGEWRTGTSVISSGGIVADPVYGVQARVRVRVRVRGLGRGRRYVWKVRYPDESDIRDKR